MDTPLNISFIKTVKERCRVCYTCVRECPAKAIRIADGQAEIMAERCINCGNCVRVCSQDAKQVLSSIEYVEGLLASEAKVSAMLAPSFAADFNDIDCQALVGMVRKLGFEMVNEVAFGADLVAKEYHKLLSKRDGKKGYISTACPAIVGFVEKYHPTLVDSLVPIVSPMVAMARVLQEIHSTDLKIVFIGPCIAKKCEAIRETLSDEVDAGLTFHELREMFDKHGISPDTVDSSDFDGPRAGLGSLFPISRGLLQAANIAEDLMEGEIVATDGRINFVEAIKEFEEGSLDASLLEVLACNGCIMGAGMTSTKPLFSRRSHMSRFVRQRMESFNEAQWQADMDQFADLDLSCRFKADDKRIPVPFDEEIGMIMANMGKQKPEDELNCGACGYDTCREHAIAIFKGLAETEMCLPNTIEQLRMTISKLATSDKQLARTQEALMHSEKLASMGQLAAGIAHEVNNPLGVVLMYAHLLIDQMDEESQSREDLTMIVEQADRCKKIVSGLLHFARQNKLQLKQVNMCDLIGRILKVAPPEPTIKVNFDNQIDDAMIEIDPDQIVQVITNLVNNAYAAMPDGGQLTVTASRTEMDMKVSISDTGVGIPKDHIPKLFEPFFTTKKIGMGTGLGLAVAYGIVKMHRGDIQVVSNDDPEKGATGTTFTLLLPINGQKAPMPINDSDTIKEG